MQYVEGPSLTRVAVEREGVLTKMLPRLLGIIIFFAFSPILSKVGQIVATMSTTMLRLD